MHGYIPLPSTALLLLLLLLPLLLLPTLAAPGWCLLA
jgi:hypothetical protein